MSGIVNVFGSENVCRSVSVCVHSWFEMCMHCCSVVCCWGIWGSMGGLGGTVFRRRLVGVAMWHALLAKLHQAGPVTQRFDHHSSRAPHSLQHRVTTTNCALCTDSSGNHQPESSLYSPADRCCLRSPHICCLTDHRIGHMLSDRR